MYMLSYRYMEILLYIFASIAGIALVGFLYTLNKDLVVSRHRLSFEYLPKEFDEFKIVHLSDLHNKRFGARQARLIEAVRKVKPDIIVITGDIVDYLLYRPEPTLKLVRGLRDVAPIYYVSGNHEWARPEYPAFKEQLIESGVHVLDNRVAVIDRGGKMLAIAGIDDYARYGNQPDIKKILHRTLTEVRDQVDERAFKILLVHRPELLREYVEHHFNLIFAGHAHGGQWNLPGLGPIYAPGQGLFPRLVSGIHRRHNVRIVISRGIGNSGILAFQRLFNKPEVIVVILNKPL